MVLQRSAAVLATVTMLGAAACVPAIGTAGGRSPDVVLGGPRSGPRLLSTVPPGHYPPPGECRLWFPGRPAGHQPPPARCGALMGRVPLGAFVLFNARAWDTEYDWRGYERRNPGFVPGIILKLLSRHGGE